MERPRQTIASASTIIHWRNIPLTLTAIIPFPLGEHDRHLLVLLHGWGANAQDLVPLASGLSLPSYHCLFPEAPFAHPQVSGGKAWYSLEQPGFEGLSQSRQDLLDWLLSLERVTQIPLNRTILGGFSQGAAMALDVGIGLPLAGLCSLSGYLHFQPQPQSQPLPPILMVHGRRDGVVPIAAARHARDELTKIQASVELHELEMDHEIPPLVLTLLSTFIKNHTF